MFEPRKLKPQGNAGQGSDGEGQDGHGQDGRGQVVPLGQPGAASPEQAPIRPQPLPQGTPVPQAASVDPQTGAPYPAQPQQFPPYGQPLFGQGGQPPLGQGGQPPLGQGGQPPFGQGGPPPYGHPAYGQAPYGQGGHPAYPYPSQGLPPQQAYGQPPAWPGYPPQGYAQQPGYPQQGYSPQPAPAAQQPITPPPPARPRHAVNRAALAEAGLIVPESGATAQLEEFRIVKRQLLAQAEELRRMRSGPASQRIMITSPHPGEGKTFCALNFAMSIAAEKEAEVVLIDLDLARSSALGLLGIPAGPGLMDALVDPRVDVRSLVIPTDVAGLSVLPGGRPTNSDAEYLASSRAPRVLDLLTEGYPRRIVVIDTPPTLATMYPAEVAKLVGQVVMVVRADKTSTNAVQDAASLLAGCPNVQLLLNAVQFSPSGRRFGSYHGYRG
ncbi:tyrosine-protein kinase family protein [Novosphingobium rosa]|uniref:tyrosine-protein kinase family protein n=1 Tax=Novosphingobium rosa TaxID=76978 RepID=UPI000A798DE8|nr:CpsD/CapB family tyrosine-protein kinase [Novosphingobium rosa]